MSGSSLQLVDALHHHLLDHPDDEPSEVVGRMAPLLSRTERADVVRRVQHRREGLGELDEVLADPRVSEVMVNGPGPVWVERQGVICRTEVHLDRPTIDLLIERLLAPIGRRVDQASPCVDGRLADGSRVHVMVPPVAIDGPYVTIRRFVVVDVDLSAFLAEDGAALLADAIQRGDNILVSGGTGSGKTTLLNVLAGMVPAGQRIITVEDAAELRLGHPHVVRLETRDASVEGGGRITTRDLVRNALRMRPDRLVIGEVRGGEAFDLVQALNTGHRGCLSTVHANSPWGAIQRLESLAVLGGDGFPLESVQRQLAAAIDLVVQVTRQPDGRRRVSGLMAVAKDGSNEGAGSGSVLNPVWAP